MTISDRLKECIEDMHVTPYEVAQKTGIGESVLSRILNNKTQRPREETLLILANYFKISLKWLKSGDGEKTENYSTQSDISAHMTTPNALIDLLRQMLTEKEEEIIRLRLENQSLENQLKQTGKQSRNESPGDSGGRRMTG